MLSLCALTMCTVRYTNSRTPNCSYRQNLNSDLLTVTVGCGKHIFFHPRQFLQNVLFSIVFSLHIIKGIYLRETGMYVKRAIRPDV